MINKSEYGSKKQRRALSQHQKPISLKRDNEQKLNQQNKQQQPSTRNVRQQKINSQQKRRQLLRDSSKIYENQEQTAPQKSGDHVEQSLLEKVGRFFYRNCCQSTDDVTKEHQVIIQLNEINANKKIEKNQKQGYTKEKSQNITSKKVSNQKIQIKNDAFRKKQTKSWNVSETKGQKIQNKVKIQRDQIEKKESQRIVEKEQKPVQAKKQINLSKKHQQQYSSQHQEINSQKNYHYQQNCQYQKNDQQTSNESFNSHNFQDQTKQLTNNRQKQTQKSSSITHQLKQNNRNKISKQNKQKSKIKGTTSSQAIKPSKIQLKKQNQQLKNNINSNQSLSQNLGQNQLKYGTIEESQQQFHAFASPPLQQNHFMRLYGEQSNLDSVILTNNYIINQPPASSMDSRQQSENKIRSENKLKEKQEKNPCSCKKINCQENIKGRICNCKSSNKPCSNKCSCTCFENILNGKDSTEKQAQYISSVLSLSNKSSLKSMEFNKFDYQS